MEELIDILSEKLWGESWNLEAGSKPGTYTLRCASGVVDDGVFKVYSESFEYILWAIDNPTAYRESEDEAFAQLFEGLE